MAAAAANDLKRAIAASASDAVLLEALQRLRASVRDTGQLLATGVGRVVRSLKKHPSTAVSEKAAKLVLRWKALVVAEEEEAKKKKGKSSSKAQQPQAKQQQQQQQQKARQQSPQKLLKQQKQSPPPQPRKQQQQQQQWFSRRNRYHCKQILMHACTRPFGT